MNHPRAIAFARKVLKDLSITEAPVDVKQIVKAYKISLAEVPPDDDTLSGVIIRNEEKTLIGVNPLHSETRKRFTIAHELGHFFLHKADLYIDRKENVVLYRKKSKRFNLTESEANCFAAELLMPGELVKRDFSKLFKSIKDSLGKVESYQYDFIIQSLAEKFVVSPEAMKIRIDNLRQA